MPISISKSISSPLISISIRWGRVHGLANEWFKVGTSAMQGGREGGGRGRGGKLKRHINIIDTVIEPVHTYTYTYTYNLCTLLTYLNLRI